MMPCVIIFVMLDAVQDSISLKQISMTAVTLALCAAADRLSVCHAPSALTPVPLSMQSAGTWYRDHWRGRVGHFLFAQLLV